MKVFKKIIDLISWFVFVFVAGYITFSLSLGEFLSLNPNDGKAQAFYAINFLFDGVGLVVFALRFQK